MNEQLISARDKAFAIELSKYENQWVAIVRSSNGPTIKEEIVASGKRMSDAMRAAEAKGIQDVVYHRVPSLTKVLIA